MHTQWDLQMVLNSLRLPPYEPLEQADIKSLSMKTAFLLAITSTRRVGELHALSVSPQCLRWGPEYNQVTLWPNPAFRPKVLSDRFVNQPIQLAAFNQEASQTTVCPVRVLRHWKEWHKGFPKSMDDLPPKVQFDSAKSFEFRSNFLKVIGESFLDKVRGLFNSWKDVADFENLLGNFNYKDTLLEKVMQDWNKDYMFGYQFLNGCNPVMIRKCKEIPDKFPVTHEMVKGFLEKGVTLQEELQAGNIYIVDYDILEGVLTANDQVCLTAPLCLLYKNRLDQIVPIAIQVSLSQTPGEKSPIFLPNDNKYDWMLAKMWVKSADFIVHQLETHFLRTHLISEVFEIAMHRQLPPVHPVYKLLKPHVRFTTAINAVARERLISKDGIITKISSLTKDGINEVIRRAMETLSHESLCFPETIEARGMKDAPKYYYRDDGMKIWEAIHNFVSAVVNIYYDSDEKVQGDEEIQGFVEDCHTGMKKSPISLKTREELVKYLTVVIFITSAQHAAVNFGQFDWYGWIPNSPSIMRKPPPKQKGKVDMKYIMESLPDRGCSSLALGTVWALSRFQKKERFLGTYPEMCFTEEPVKEAIKTFGKKLKEVTNIIKSRNEGLAFDYCYLSPDKIPNSVAI
ncbi:polyunsaturated fatty acid 5-lipoxygenase-like [Rhinichthys klamathensis goyatoka]|uniref:polyunsaturated fatty acid 5-lipoxygenase-like n=1 Tax=Rhinichthys klamathensis goyatoka TaxID=3034132 RepID=UPI0024B589B4|nr:polyunsaturated fatty acid 5-lipoxygenase-like [Rhinichthys klamathensis goyatoka]